MQTTPGANRVHIGIFGKRNSGKSSLLNAITNQDVAVVSSVAGTTTDPVFKPMEVHGIGPAVFIDTAGFDDAGTLGEKRVQQTQKVVDKTDIAIVVCSDTDIEDELVWIKFLENKNIPTIIVFNKIDLLNDVELDIKYIKAKTNLEVIALSAKEKNGVATLFDAIKDILAQTSDTEPSILGDLVSSTDVVLLVMPQDIQAPKGRLILPQVQTIRELLDKKCIVISCTNDSFGQALKSLSAPPKLIVTDSQLFKTIYEQKPEGSMLSSFSVLFAKYKGNISMFLKGAASIDTLTESSNVLIAEACTHAPLTEDIGSKKIPAMLRKKFGEKLGIDIVSGNDFPADLSKYQLIIHCGACMFNRKLVLNRIEQARQQRIPITNYGICIAHVTGIIDKLVY